MALEEYAFTHKKLGEKWWLVQVMQWKKRHWAALWLLNRRSHSQGPSAYGRQKNHSCHGFLGYRGWWYDHAGVRRGTQNQPGGRSCR
jgi:hypothetical protein